MRSSLAGGGAFWKAASVVAVAGLVSACGGQVLTSSQPAGATPTVVSSPDPGPGRAQPQPITARPQPNSATTLYVPPSSGLKGASGGLDTSGTGPPGYPTAIKNPSDPLPLETVPPPNFVQGLMVGNHQPPPGGPKTQVNSWFGVVADQEVLVGAGSKPAFRSDRSQAPTSTGELYVVHESSSTASLLSGRAYYHPSVPGPFTITAAAGPVLTVAGANGTTFTFDAASNTFRP